VRATCSGRDIVQWTLMISRNKQTDEENSGIITCSRSFLVKNLWIDVQIFVISLFWLYPDDTQIPLTGVYVFPKVRTGRICFSSKIIASMAFPQWSQPTCSLNFALLSKGELRSDHCIVVHTTKKRKLS